MVTTSGTLTCMRAETGEVLWTQELESEFYSSPSLAGGLIYLCHPHQVFQEVLQGNRGRLDLNPAWCHHHA